MSLKISKLASVLVLFVFLVGCEEEFQVTVSDRSEGLMAASFSVEEISEKQKSMLHTVRMYDQDEELIWHLKRNSSDKGTDLRHVRYGVVPRGFDVKVPASNLKSGQAYTLVVQGSGYGVLRFTVDSSGYLAPLKHKLSQF